MVTIAAPGEIRRPIDAYLPTAAQLVAIERHRERAINQCLGAAGQRLKISEGPGLEAFATSLVRDRTVRSDLYGFFDVAAGGAYGYADPPGTVSGYSEKPDPGLPASDLSTCSDAVDASSGNVMLTMEGSLLPSGGPPVPLSDSRFVAVAKEWSNCMAAKGLDYASPVLAISDPRWRAETTGPHADQIATATTDLACKKSTNLVGVAVALQDAYDQLYIDENRTALDAARARYTPS